MKYIVHYWRRNLAEVTGLEHATTIDEDQLMTLVTEQKVNVMIQHVAAANGKEAQSYCYIDDLNHRFQLR